jgi:hypothetical protein
MLDRCARVWRCALKTMLNFGASFGERISASVCHAQRRLIGKARQHAAVERHRGRSFLLVIDQD